MKIRCLIVLIIISATLTDCKSSKIIKPQLLYPSKTTKTKYHNDYAITHYPKRIKLFKDNPLNFGDIVLLGNSIVEGGGDWSKKLNISNVRNRGIGGDITDGVLARLNEIIHFKPKIVFLLIGVNDLDNLVYQKEIPSINYIANNILKIASKIRSGSPKTKIYIQTILPSLDSKLNLEIDKLNIILAKSANRKDFKIIDLHSSFLNEKKNPNKSLYKDRLHLNDKGYAIWVGVLQNYFN